MLSVIGNWIYILCTSCIVGSAVLYPFYRYKQFCFEKWESYFFAGIVTLTTFAQFFSLFYKVGFAANLIVVGVCCLILVFMGRKLREMMSPIWKNVTWKSICIILLAFLFFAYGTSVGNIHYDSNLYHAQSIRWIEEYGVVPGLGNLQSRLAYNSSSFCLSALFSMAFLIGQSLHTVAGLFAFVTFVVALELFKVFCRKKVVVSDFARLGLFYYITVIYKEMNSPASDYFTMLILFYIIVKWLDLLEKEETSVVPYALLSVVGVFAVSLKLSAGLVLLVVIKPACQLIKEKRGKEIALYLGLGILVIAPFLARNVMISGWLIYPYTGVDLFRLDWEMPAFIAKYDAQEIQVWARGIYDVAKFDMPIREWMPNWFRIELTGTEKLLIVGSLVAVFVQLGYGIMAILKKNRRMCNIFLVQSALMVSFLIWLFSAPMMRYGYVYPILLPLLVFGSVLLELAPYRYKLLSFFFCLFIGLRGIQMLGEAAEMFKWFGVSAMQVDYDTFEAEPELVGNITVFVPTEDDRIGYELFPSAPNLIDVLPRGERIEDGFLYEWNYD